jgi:23S rRNA (guanine745-N1)-methyltransferase
MTPFAFKASKALVEEIKMMGKFSCQADFVLRLYKK